MRTASRHSRTVAAWAGAALRCMVIVVVGLMGLGKLLALQEFTASLADWGVPARVAPHSALLVAGGELGLACWWAAAGRPRCAVGIATGFVACVTGVYLVRYFTTGEPSCQCMGLWARYVGFRTEARDVLLRNGVFLAAGVGGVWLTPAREGSHPAARPPLPAGGNGRRGFSLVELLVVIAIVAVVSSLLVSGVTRIRERARAGQSLAYLRQHAAVFTQYTSDWRDTWPTFYRLWSTPSVGSPYFAASDGWPLQLSISGYYAHPYLDAFQHPQAPPAPVPVRGGGAIPARHGISTAYLYDCSYLADPGFWNVETRTGPRQWRATRATEVLFPSHKTIHASYFPWIWRLADAGRSDGERIDWSFVDGSAARVRASDAVPNRVAGDGPLWFDLGIMHTSASPPGTHTLDGLRGRDITSR